MLEKPVRRANPGGWGLAGTIGLLSVIFLWDYASRADKGTSAPKQKSGRDTPLADVTIEDENRGRLAGRLSKIPARGWKDALLRIYSNIAKHRILALAAGTTYYSVLDS
jgi:membrane protein